MLKLINYSRPQAIKRNLEISLRARGDIMHRVLFCFSTIKTRKLVGSY